MIRTCTDNLSQAFRNLTHNYCLNQRYTCRKFSPHSAHRHYSRHLHIYLCHYLMFRLVDSSARKFTLKIHIYDICRLNFYRYPITASRKNIQPCQIPYRNADFIALCFRYLLINRLCKIRFCIIDFHNIGVDRFYITGYITFNLNQVLILNILFLQFLQRAFR